MSVTTKTVAVAIAFLITAAAIAQSGLPERLQFLATNRIFERVQALPGFNLQRAARYGFFFTSSDPAVLVQIRAQLEPQGYDFVEVHRDKTQKYWLQLAKSEIHTVESMVARNRLLYAVAESSRAAVYDGWDIERNE